MKQSGTSHEIPGTVPPEAQNHILVLDGLRGLAILLVMLLHTWEISWIDFSTVLHSPIDLSPIPATGFVGVELFFFISAFCLSLPYARALLTGQPLPTLRHFLARRAIKILPSYYLALGVLLLCFPHPDLGADRLWFHIGTHVLFINNWFPETLGSINGVFWSMAVEVQFYLLFPLLMYCLRKSLLVTVSGMVAVAQCWHAYSVIAFRSSHDLNAFDWHDLQTISFLDLFAAGIGGAFLYTYWSRRPEIRRYSPLFTLIALLAFAAFIAEMYNCYTTRADQPLRLWQVQYRLLVAFTLFVLAVSGAFSMRWLRAALGNRLLLFFSLISYNLYIWHQWLALYLLSHRFPAYHTHDPHNDPHWQVTFMLVAWPLGIGVATLLTFLWERPFLRGKLPWPLSLLSGIGRGIPPLSTSNSSAADRP